MALLIRSLGCKNLLRQQALFFNKKLPMTSSAYDEMSNFWKKNRELERPMSPFLSSYKPHLAMMTSLAHRISGVTMSLAISGVAITLMCLPSDFCTYFDMIKDLNVPPLIIYAFKYALAGPVTYHYLNGFRHLAWDGGVGFGLKELYKSAYFVMALTFAVASGFVFLM
ncbi:succinate dehydrogenase cytochrome b560 subunit, mitochondrial-like [Gigantopelta aegis]|uniref:succinate dehydrogenase cytochrome b560 subunit, mitochondrial-like n=1 Tax=Gigantopelta aegis TaxID=1735272 RepID=UPI001B88B37D|nr:succinate dehydrogenase cytochrome b560 subunit, mitochondrial-like [Gigantopelta aegis]